MCDIFHLSADYLLLGKEDVKPDSSAGQAQAQAPSGGYSLILIDTNPSPWETRRILRSSGMSEEDVDRMVPLLPVALASGLTLEEAYRRAKDFESCGLVKVVRDESAQSQESMLRADPIEAPKEKGAGLGFGGTVLAVIVGIILSLLILMLF